jgi:thiamine pyrophosphate-dependent acetolactate synthase large subunit-like protein
LVIGVVDQTPMLLCQNEKIAVQIARGYAKASGKPMIEYSKPSR